MIHDTYIQGQVLTLWGLGSYRAGPGDFHGGAVYLQGRGWVLTGLWLGTYRALAGYLQGGGWVPTGPGLGTYKVRYLHGGGWVLTRVTLICVCDVMKA